MAEEDKKHPLGFVEGEYIYIKGTVEMAHDVKRYYKATVVDVRQSDHSVKVQYLDGSMKRWKDELLHGLVAGTDMHDSSVVFGGLTDAEVKSCFAEADLNADGKLDASEVQASLQSVGQVCSLDVAHNLVRDSSSSRDDAVCFEDFHKLVRARCTCTPAQPTKGVCDGPCLIPLCGGLPGRLGPPLVTLSVFTA